MADLIQLLPDAIASQIAAGEVIQRPASVVKELMENAIDAGADHIQLIIKDGGKQLVQVIDNGCGMSENDARMCFERHATSKLRSADDLFSLHTMGFRGEAMATVAAIAHVEMKTRQPANELGTRIIIEGSDLKVQEPCQSPTGTNIQVKNLFFNVPARRNFLKSNPVEARHIMDEFQRLALAHPDIFFSMHHNDSETFHLPVGNLRQRITAVFGSAYNQRLVPVEEETDILKVHGFVSKPEFARKTRGEQFFFVNQRFIKSSYLHHAVMTAFEEILPDGVFPFYALFLQIDPSRIDVNVHPTKQEIKFDDEKLVYNYLKVAIRHALGQYNVTPTLDFEQEGSFAATRISTVSPGNVVTTIPSKANNQDDFSSSAGGGGTQSWDSSLPASERQRQANNLRHWEDLYVGLGLDGTDAADPDPEEAPHTLVLSSKMAEQDEAQPATEAAGFKDYKAPYQLHGRFIVSVIKSGFLLIDQQAAHERILYEQYLQALEQRRAATQQQLFAQTIQLSPADSELLHSMLPQMQLLGFDIAPFGKNAFIVNGVPAEIAGKQNEEVIIDQVLQQLRDELDLQLGINERMAKALAKSTAVRRGQRLGIEEMQSLIDRLFACANPYRSPAGKACFFTMDMDEIEQRLA